MEKFRLKVNSVTIFETSNFGECLDQAFFLVHEEKMPASAIDILSLDEPSQLWMSVWGAESDMMGLDRRVS